MLHHERAPMRSIQAPYPPAASRSYPWLFFRVNRTFFIGLCVSMVVIGCALVLYLLVGHIPHAISPQSVAGIGFAVAGTLCFVASGATYSLKKRRKRKPALGQLNAFLQWHVSFAIMGVVLLTMHAFGHFEPISGTFALYSLIVLVASGFVGRALDQVLPRLIAMQVDWALTGQGEDMLTAISEQLQNTQEKTLRMPIPLLHFVVRDEIEVLRREHMMRLLIHSWRIIHIALAIITIGLICWHLVFAAQVMLHLGGGAP